MAALNSKRKVSAPTPEALAARAAGRAAAKQRRLAERQSIVNPDTPTLISENHLTEFEYALAAHKDIKTVRRHRALRIGPPWVKIGRSVFYPKAEVLAWMNAQMVKPCRTRGARAAA
jgi:hypothetical protein